MKKLFILSGIFLLIGILELMSCSKEDEKTASPTIAFYDETGFISQDTVAKYNDTLRFKVYSIYNGTDKLEKFVVRMNGYLFIDSAINASSFSIDIVANKTIEDVEVWKFETTDNAGHKTDFEITITGLFGPIKSYKDIFLGAQDNPSIESFISYSNDTVTKYFQTAAYIHQAAIDMFCFYEDIPDHQNFMTLAAPGSNISGIFTGMTSPENYSIKNTTYFVLTTLSVLEFESIENDARVIDAFVTGNKILMANQLNPEDIYAFLLESGKYGLLKVTSVEGAEAGTLKFDMKIQE